MEESMGMAVQRLLDNASNPALQVSVVLALVGAFFAYLFFHARKAVCESTIKVCVFPSWLSRKAVSNALIRHRTWRARREMQMHKKRELALKERAAAALIQWLQYQVYSGEMTVDESYDMQKMLARVLRHPSMTPLFDADYVKNEIKKRLASGMYKRAPNRREKLKHILSA